jgi:hypothetical protein
MWLAEGRGDGWVIVMCGSEGGLRRRSRVEGVKFIYGDCDCCGFVFVRGKESM